MIFGQSIPGAEPQPSEVLDWRSHPRFRQSGIFGDIQPWSLGRIWMEVCSSESWSNQLDPSSTWSDITDTTTSWTQESVPDIDISRC